MSHIKQILQFDANPIKIGYRIFSYRVMSNLSMLKTRYNKGIRTLSLPISQKTYLRHPTHSCHIMFFFTCFIHKLDWDCISIVPLYSTQTPAHALQIHQDFPHRIVTSRERDYAYTLYMCHIPNSVIYICTIQLR